MPISTQEASPQPKVPRTPGKPRVVLNVMSNWGAYVVAMGINFFLSPFVVRHLGNTQYGVWTIILALTGYLGLLDLGVRGAVTRYVAKFHAEAQHKRASNVASSAMVIFSSAGIIAILASFILAAVVVGHFKIPAEFVTASRIVLILAGFSVGTSLVNGVFGGILVGLQRFDITNAIEIGLSILRAGAIVMALHLGYGIIALASIQLSFNLIRWVANVILARHFYPELRIDLSEADYAGVKLIFSFSAFSFLLHISGTLIYASDNVVIGAYMPVAAVTFYVIGGNLIEYTRTLLSGISQTMTPLASSIEAQKDWSQVQRVVLFSSRAGTMIILPIAITFMLRGSSFIGLWMGAQYAHTSGTVLMILSMTLLFWPATSVTSGSLLGMSKHRPLVPVLLAEGICNLALSILLVRGSLGILGVAWGTVIPSLTSSLVFWPWYVRRTLGIRPLTYIRSVWIRPGVAIVPFALGTYAIERYWPAGNLIMFFSQVLLTLPLAAAGYWLMCLDQAHRQDYSRRISSVMVRVLART